MALEALCPHCRLPLESAPSLDVPLQPCSGCGRQALGRNYPRNRQELERIQALPPLPGERKARCFQHEERAAETSCSTCGRNVCNLCRLELGEQVLCPDCAVRTRSTSERLVTQRKRLDQLAFVCGLGGLMSCYGIVFTAPLTWFLLWKARRSPPSLVPRSPWRMRFAFFGALLQTLLILAAIAGIVYSFSRKDSW